MKRISYEIFKLVVKINAVFIYILRKKLFTDFVISEIADFF